MEKKTRIIKLEHPKGIVLINNKKYHLYFVNDDEIKEGDWYLSPKNTLSKCIKVGKNYIASLECGSYMQKSCKKIIATTDKSLTIKIVDRSKSKPIDSGIRDKYKKIHLPQPSQAFIEKYCKVGGIDEILVEYGGNIVEFQNFCSDLGFSYDSAFGWYENTNPGHRPNTSTLEERFNNKLKVDSHNTITIHPIKDSWSREEVEIICKQAFISGGNTMYNISRNRKSFTFNGTELSKKWIKENL